MLDKTISLKAGQGYIYRKGNIHYMVANHYKTKDIVVTVKRERQVKK